MVCTASYTMLMVIWCRSVFAPSGLDMKPLVVPLHVNTMYVVKLFASRASSCYKHDIGTLSWLNLETLKRALTPLFTRTVRCSTHGHSFVRLLHLYMHILARQKPNPSVSHEKLLSQLLIRSLSTVQEECVH